MIMMKSLQANLACLLMLSFVHLDASSRILANVPVGNSPAGIAITPDGRFAYVANNNNAGIAGWDTVSVINLQTNTVVQTISDASFNQPYTITINAAGTIAYVTNSNGATITRINTATNTVLGTIVGFDGPSGMVITPDGTTAYVNNYGGPILGSGLGHTVSVVDLVGDAISATINLAPNIAPASLAITPNGAFVYVINYVDGNPGTGTISIIRTSDNTVVGTISGFSGPFQIVINSEGTFAYVTNFGSNDFAPVGTTVSVVNLKTNSITATIPVGTQPAGLALSSDGHFLYVSVYNTLYLGPPLSFTLLTALASNVTVIDTYTNQVVSQKVLLGPVSPVDIAISSDGSLAYISNYSANRVSVVNILDNSWLSN